jgi:hypothetical protein
MCDRPDCPTKDRPGSKYLKWNKDPFVTDNPLFNPELDQMPDGYHAKPQRLWAAKPQKKRLEPQITEDQLDQIKKRRREEYLSMPEPRPNYHDWLALMDEEDRFWDAFWIRKTASFPSDRLKAISQINETSKAKPKQSIELTSRTEKVDIDELLVKILRIKGRTEEEIQSIVGDKRVVQ